MSFFHEVLSHDIEDRRQQRIYGLVTARVTNMLGTGLFELDYLSMLNDQPLAPARMMMPMAGGRRGTYFMPENGDEVVVAFELGDVNQPVILGAVWNHKDQPPSQASSAPANNVRTIVSRSGHQITLDDSPGGEKVVIQTASGHTLTLDDTAPGKVTLSSAGGSTIEMDDATGTLKCSATVRLELSAQTLRSVPPTSRSMPLPGVP